jgi:Zn-dependent peptidase ImmA (M78 family)
MEELWEKSATKYGEQLAQEHFSELPIDPFYIADKLGIIVDPLPPENKGVSGMLVYANNTFGIQYATYTGNPGFQNFCLGHELGHYSIPGHPEKLLRNGYHESQAGFSSGERCELEADHFAAGLLMPSGFFDAALNKVEKGINAVEALAEVCETSLTATAIRYAQRTPDPVAIVVSEGNIIRYCFMSDEMKELEGLCWIKKDTALPRNTATYRFNQSKNNILNGDRAEGVTSLIDWFSCNLQYDVYEEVIGLGEYGKTLTVLSIDKVLDQEEIDEEDDLMESWTPRFKR